MYITIFEMIFLSEINHIIDWYDNFEQHNLLVLKCRKSSELSIVDSWLKMFVNGKKTQKT